ncbi:MAG: hemolysin family protein [Candidatus Latescibacterota bacterium]|nr:hemolysin family protein [Candidatus Latescibacterota bacterium]
MVELVVAVAAAIGISSLCSLFEAVLYAVPVAHVENLAQSGRRAGRVLRDLRQNIDRPIAAILTLNTIAHTVGATVAGASAERVLGHQWLPAFSVLFTLAVLVISEILPKTAGVAYSRVLSAPIALPLQALVQLFSPFIWLSEGLTRLVSRDHQQVGVSAEDLHVLAQLGQRTGSLQEDEAKAIANVLTLRDRPVQDIMTPRTVVFSLNVVTRVGEIREQEDIYYHSRIPVFDQDADDVVGMVHRRDLMAAMARQQFDATMESMMGPIDFVAGTMGIDRLLHRFLHHRTHLSMVIDEFGSLAGLVTLEDTLEALLGYEIVDEYDPAVDMRELAHDRRRELQSPDDT